MLRLDISITMLWKSFKDDLVYFHFWCISIKLYFFQVYHDKITFKVTNQWQSHAIKPSLSNSLLLTEIETLIQTFQLQSDEKLPQRISMNKETSYLRVLMICSTDIYCLYQWILKQLKFILNCLAVTYKNCYCFEHWK